MKSHNQQGVSSATLRPTCASSPNMLRAQQKTSVLYSSEELFVCLSVFFAEGCKHRAAFSLVVQGHVSENKDVKNGHGAWTFQHKSQREKNNSR